MTVQESKQYEYNDVEYHKRNKMSRICVYETPLEIEECPFIEYITDSLLLFINVNYEVNTHNYKTFDLNYLSKCYNHIICIHSFCSNNIKREKIQHYVRNKIGKCTMKQNCIVLKHHSLRKREIIKSNQIQQPENNGATDHTAIMIDILEACLNSLHIYVIHIESEMRSSRSRFASNAVNTQSIDVSAPKNDLLQLVDEIDGLTQFILENAPKFAAHFVYYVTQEEYDWETILYDLDYNNQPFQSNIYLLCQEHHKEYLFDLLCKNYENDIHNINNNEEETNNVIALNFGISVLNWFEYGDGPTYGTFMEEISNNECMSKKLLEQYKAHCLVKINNSETVYKYTLEEMLSLKLYTDTNELCAELRKSHWNLQQMIKLKRNFYWWAMNVYKAALYHARPLPRFDSDRVDPMKLYHGINTILAVDAQVPKYHGPVSTSLVDTVGHQFSNSSGLLWTIETTYYNPFTFVTAIDVSWISCHKNEAEMLLIDQYLHRSATKNYVNDNEMKVDYLLYTLKIYTNKITDTNMFWIQIGFVVSDELLPIMKQRALSEPTKYIEKGNTKTLLHRLFEELHINELLNQYNELLQKNVDLLLNTLKTCTQKIVDEKRFWRQIGFNWTNAFIPFIKQRSLLNNTKYEENGTAKTLL
eukprot:390674_1